MHDTVRNTLNTRIPNFILLVVYQPKEGVWHGFCAPYDVTCEAETEEEARARLEELVALYSDGLKQYGYPTHLALRELSNAEDQKVLEHIL